MQAEERAVANDRQALAQPVVQFGGDPFALPFLRFDQPAREGLLRGVRPFQLRDAPAIKQNAHAGHARRSQRDEPPRAVKRRRHDDAQAAAFGVPEAVAVGRDHRERVFARRNVRVISQPARPGVHPVRVQAFELVLEADLFGFDETERGVVDFEIALARRDSRLIAEIHQLAIQQTLFDHHRRRVRIGRDGFGINHRHALLGRKPQFAVARADARRLIAAVAFRVEHPVALAVNNRIDCANPAVGEIVELPAAHAIDAQVATHPEIATRVFQDLEHSIVEQAVVNRDVGDPAVFDPAQTAVIRANPNGARLVFVKRPDTIALQTFTLRPGSELAASDPRDAAVGSDPEPALPVFKDRSHVVARQTVFRRVDRR
ncbi:MAG: hypothetical protein JMDDDDMK_00354 [Acidobacteria bacterium]|nr:hypothetical protein [Acidobacteriota bacterium]